MKDHEIRRGDPLWYKDAVIYQLHVKSFFDGNNDGVGDFVGLTRKMRYLESLGITAVWLLPFYPSPLRDDGYDIADYFGINPAYGTMDDFRTFLDEAHKRGIRVITELVLNHTSDQHEWFRKSREAKPGSYWRNFYVWSDTNRRYTDARIIFKDFETSNWTWDTQANAYFWHRFYSHQPDLNFENKHVHKALFKVIDFWLAMGVDGMRLDAVPYLYEKEGTNCENLPRTFDFLRSLRAHVEEGFTDRMLLAEANQWPEDAVAYFGNGDMCHMAFHFPLMPRMFMALQMEDRFPIMDILDQTPAIPEQSQWAIFLRNHDELTLEMVSEEERDFMYRSYARDLSARINLGIRRRLAPLVQNSRRRLELLNILLLSLPGTPVIYYGDEIGMGDNHFLGDRNGVRTPMQWSPDRNAGYSDVNPQRIFLPVIIDPEYHYHAVNVETEEQNLSSLLWWMRRAIAMRRHFRAFSRGELEFVKSTSAAVLSFFRSVEGETILVVVNLSRFSQAVTLDLRRFAGCTPVDVFSGNSFPRISTAPYQMTLGFHDYFWLELQQDRYADPRTESYMLPDFVPVKNVADLFDGASGKKMAAEILPDYLEQRTTAGCRNKAIRQTNVVDRLVVKRDRFSAVILIVKVLYADAGKDIIALPLTIEPEDAASVVVGEDKGLVLGLVDGGKAGVVYDCSHHPVFSQLFFELIRNRKTVKGLHGSFVGESEPKKSSDGVLTSAMLRVVKVGKRNTCITLGDRWFVKMFRRIDEGIHPEIELHRKVAKSPIPVCARYIGALKYRGEDAVNYALGFCTAYFNHSRTLWYSATEAVSNHLEVTLANRHGKYDVVIPGSEESLQSAEPGGSAEDGIFRQRIRHVGTLTADMHKLLASDKLSDFSVEPFSALYQRSLYQSMRGLTHRVFSRIEASMEKMSPGHAMEMQSLLSRKKELLDMYMAILQEKLNAVRMRIHGDYHLGQIMVMDEQYRVCDFEGLDRLPLSERRLKRSPIRDIATMIHSFYAVAHHALFHNVHIHEKDRQQLLPEDQLWAADMAEAFVTAYLDSMKGTGLVTATAAETGALLRLYLIERALIELEQAIDGNFEETNIPVRSLFHYMGSIGFLSPESTPEEQE